MRIDHRPLLNDLFNSQRLAVLATEGDGTPYTSLVAFAAADDLKQLLFVTSRHSRKYRNLTGNPSVAVLIDSRSNRESDFSDSMAVTAIGRATECPEEDREKLAPVYLEKHPNLADFISSSDAALISVAVTSYLIATFDKTIEIELD